MCCIVHCQIPISVTSSKTTEVGKPLSTRGSMTMAILICSLMGMCWRIFASATTFPKRHAWSFPIYSAFPGKGVILPTCFSPRRARTADSKQYDKHGEKHMRTDKYDTGFRQSLRLFLKEVSFCFQRAHCCSFSEVTIYVPKFALTPSCRSSLRDCIYGRKIIIEMRLENMLAQLIITLSSVTDFCHPVHTTNRHDVDPRYQDRKYLRTENLRLTVSLAHKFILEIIPQMHSRLLNVITVSPGAESSLIHSFGSSDDPKGAFTRVLLANI